MGSPRILGASLLRLRGAGWLLLALFLPVACTTGSPRHGFLVDPRPGALMPLGQGDVTFSPSSDFAPVQVSDASFREAFTHLLLTVPLRLSTRSAGPWAGHTVRVSWPPRDGGNFGIEEGYARLCERRGSPGDCLWLLGDDPRDPHLSQGDRFALGLSMALLPAVGAATSVLRDFSEHALTTLLTGLSLYLVVLLAPEPLSKGLALAMTVFLWSYLGQELWGLISATKQLWEESGSANTFLELSGASERYAQVLGPNTLRILILLATWKAGSKGKDALEGRGLPGFSQAVSNAATVGRFHLPAAASEATSVSVVDGRMVLTLPSGAGAILAMQQELDEEGDVHHIATVENAKSPARGGPWTPRFKRFFDKAGMSMEDPANKVRIPGHQGPHPEEYHQEVYERLVTAMRRCESTVQCREALTRELAKLAGRIKQAGSRLNKLVTRAE